ncbi:VOC family protein [Nocardia sp. alder85J]|uniref:VOC family protein n=1 Tax=Nocardia sp. alder85J TaxID=2862949 RepID=UPI001CD5B3F5|nr:VOC family protein [Nocardia sp. alder85J]MCX4093438.1 glyoxalase/bleomycin resistance/extradiol dioxygenase family protein [Nocardia sp. alder85J]
MPSTMIFLNLPVADLERSKIFYERLGWKIDQEFTDDAAACVVIDDNISVMLLSQHFFHNFTQRPRAITTATVGAVYALALGSPHQVDALVAAAVAAGGIEELYPDRRAQERAVGMYGRTFLDPDGHQWEPFWMQGQ